MIGKKLQQVPMLSRPVCVLRLGHLLTAPMGCHQLLAPTWPPEHALHSLVGGWDRPLERRMNWHQPGPAAAVSSSASG